LIRSLEFFTGEILATISYTGRMNFYILGKMWTKNFLFVGILLTGLLLGCGTGDSDTYVRFQAEGQTYEVKGPTLVVTHMLENVHFLDLTYFPMTAVPGAMVQWRMRLDSLEQLVGQNLDLNTVDPNKVGPLVLLRLTEDLSVHVQQHSNAHFKVDRIEEGFVEGSFSGTDLKYVSKTKEMTGKVDITARFRAKLIQKTIGQ
jgi:hypothetical protein